MSLEIPVEDNKLFYELITLPCKSGNTEVMLSIFFINYNFNYNEIYIYHV